MIVVRFDQADCVPCSVRAECTNAIRWGGQITLRPRRLHDLIHANHTAQDDEKCQAKYALLAGVEGTIRQPRRSPATAGLATAGCERPILSTSTPPSPSA
ncbi:transposase [Streptomyces shenzhenensis]|uniref:transposase n=1 Tax=Streptomyces shenzhenensis TaxID=943815 RepID=UPI003F53E583